MTADVSSQTDTKNTSVNAALVLVDVQKEFIHPAGRFSVDGFSGMDTEAIYQVYVTRVNAVANAFRARSLPVFHVVTQIREDYLDSAFAPMWKSFGFCAEGGLLTPGSWGVAIPDEIQVASDDFVLAKKGHSAFRGTSLDRTLRSLACRNLVLGGGAIGGCLADTAYDGATLGYRQALISDVSFSLQRVDGLVADATVDVVTSDDLFAAQGWWTQAPPELDAPAAVVVLDSDVRVLGPNGIAQRRGATPEHVARSAAAIDRVICEARSRDWPVIRVSTIVASPAFSSFPRTAEGDQEAALFLAAGYLDEETTATTSIVKSGPSAFGGTPLDRILRNLGITRVVVAGGDSREGRSVIATVREGAALGYELFVIGDTTYPSSSTSLGDADRRCTLIELATWQQAITGDGEPRPTRV
jgi:nicotinamidase-related amidase